MEPGWHWVTWVWRYTGPKLEESVSLSLCLSVSLSLSLSLSFVHQQPSGRPTLTRRQEQAADASLQQEGSGLRLLEVSVTNASGHGRPRHGHAANTSSCRCQPVWALPKLSAGPRPGERHRVPRSVVSFCKEGAVVRAFLLLVWKVPGLPAWLEHSHGRRRASPSRRAVIVSGGITGWIRVRGKPCSAREAAAGVRPGVRAVVTAVPVRPAANHAAVEPSATQASSSLGARASERLCLVLRSRRQLLQAAGNAGW